MAVRVKVPVAKVIEALNTRIAENKENEKHNLIAEENYLSAMAKYNANIVKEMKDKVTVSGLNYRSWSNTLTVEYKVADGVALPEEPKRENKNTLSHWALEEIQNALNILKMTDEEFVNASTMKDISKYL